MKIRVLLLVLLITAFSASSAFAGTNVKVMTYNVDEGTDFSPILNFFLLNEGTLETAVTETISEVVNSNPPLRMQLIAQEIAAAQPDVVGLQEVAQWTVIPPPGSLNPPIYLNLLQEIQLALADLQQSYTAIEVVDEFHIDNLTLPSVGTVSFADRDVILVRSDLVDAIGTNHAQGHYSAFVPLPSPYDALTRGWAYVDVPMNGTGYRFITTHLEDGTNTASWIFLFVQAKQEIELVTGAPSNTPLPLIIGGDFNTVANNASSLTHLTYLFMLGNGFTDAWTAAGQGRGLTCCQEDLTIKRSELTQRIDQIFTRNGVGVIGTQLVGNHLDTIFVDGTPESSWPSDHASVASQLQIGLP